MDDATTNAALAHAGFRAAQFVRCEWQSLEAQHRYEDLGVIAAALEALRPAHAVELGTAGGGFALFLAQTLAAWGGRVLSVDVEPIDLTVLAVLERQPNLTLLTANLLSQGRRGHEPHPEVVAWCRRPRTFLYCDNGAKERELELYAPALGPDGSLGVHDYATEVRPAWAEAFLAGLGFRPFRHDVFEALAHPEYYPQSLTRLWAGPDALAAPAAPGAPVVG